jgi:large subunit ribosomal protein L31
MKTATHPKWYPEAKVTCACGNSFTVGSTIPEIKLDICGACHPYYTGTMKYVDTAGRVDAFRMKREGAAKEVLSKATRREMKRQQRIREELERPETLAELRKQYKKKAN